VRAAVGPDAFIAGTFDPHGNEDAEFLRHADMAFCVKYFPHYDSYLQGERAARTLVRAIRGDFRPTHVTVKVPIISPTVLQWTGASPWMDLVQRALTWEARAPDTYVNFFFGFPWSDVPDVGITFQVLTNGKSDLARRIATDMAETAWRQRAALLNTTKIHSIPDGVALARAAVAAGNTPVVLADHSDRSGYATWLLREIVAQELAKTLIVTVADPKVAAALAASGAKVGDAFDMEVGGLADESAGQPVRIQGTIRAIGGGVRRGAHDAWVQIAFGEGNFL
jgi:microcystin degradation protein MlrC